MNPKNLFNKLFKKSKYSESDKGLGSNKEKTKLNYDFHKLSLEELSQRFETSLTNGLSVEKAKNLLLTNGKNELNKQTSIANYSKDI